MYSIHHTVLRGQLDDSASYNPCARSVLIKQTRPNSLQAHRQKRLENVEAFCIEGVVSVRQGVGSNLNLRRFPERLRQQLAVGPWCGPVSIAPYSENLRRRANATRFHGLKLLAQKRREHDHRAEQNHC